MKKALVALAVVALIGGGALLAWDRLVHDAAHQHGSKARPAAPEHDQGMGGLTYTHFSERTELFVEFPQLIAGESSAFAAHLTRLADFKPVDQGTLTVQLLDLNGTLLESYKVDAPSTPGIFRPIAMPTQAGRRQLLVRLEAPNLSAIHDLGTVIVYSSRESAARAAHSQSESGSGAVSFRKEQQWQVDFALTVASKRTVRDTVAATGTIRAVSDGEALLSAPAAGQLTANDAFPRVGMKVEKGQILALLVPRLGGDTDLATLEAAARKARIRFEQLRRERERMESLFALEAVAQRRVLTAVTEENLAQTELEASERRFGQYAGKGGGIPIRAPLSGVVADIKVTPGTFVNDGQALLHIVNTGRLWLEARIPETEVGRIVKPSGAWFRVDGYQRIFEIQEGSNGRVIAFGGVVDAMTRTVPLILEFTNVEAMLRIGMAAQVYVVAGRTLDALAVPFSAVLDENGQSAVFVQKSGESFERRIVQLGVRDGDWVALRSGVAPGERVVSRGAYLVKLASTAPAVAGHGHAH